MKLIDEGRLLRELRRGLTHVGVPAVFERWLERQPRAPRLVGATEAARILGVPKTHVARLRSQGRMPEPLVVDGGHDVYVRAEVVRLGKQLQRDRDARALAGRKGDRNGNDTSA